MRVKELIEQLKYYKPDDEIIVAYWDKSTVEGYAEVTLTDDQWTDIVAEQDSYEAIDLERFGETLQEIASEVGQSIHDEPEGEE
jgi:hypothetical protein